MDMKIKKNKPVWLQLLDIKKKSPLLFQICFIYLMIELIVFVAPVFVPATTYISYYLTDKAKGKTQSFFNNKNSLIPDDVTGWKNNPEFTRGNWIIDRHGSRNIHDFTTNKSDKKRVLFLGSSMINGGSRIKNSETISAYIEDGDIEALNFATMMYSIDQVLLDYQSRLYKYEPDIIVVGIDLEPTAGLKNHYIPFRFPLEENMPYIKSRFTLKSGTLELVKASPDKLLAELGSNSTLLDFLAENDSFYFKFKFYCHMGFLPISDKIRKICLKAVSLSRYFYNDYDGTHLLETIMNELVTQAKQNGSEVVFLMNTDRTVLKRGGIHKFLPDLYEKNLIRIASQGFNVIDLRKILRANENKGRLFAADQSHYSAISNKIIAEAIKPVIKSKIRMKSVKE